jgi:hypothetical protein
MNLIRAILQKRQTEEEVMSVPQASGYEMSRAPAVSRTALWAGRVLSALPVLMMTFSAVMKLIRHPSVIKGMAHRAINRWQHRLNRERPTCTERNQSRLESADGSMATVALGGRKTMFHEARTELT